MKIVTALVAVQFILLVIMAFRLSAVDTQLAVLLDESRTQAEARQGAADRNSARRPTLNAGAPGAGAATAEDIRQIMQEEFQAFADANADSARNSTGGEQRPRRDTRTVAQIDAVQRDFDQDLNYFIGQGRIDEKDMAALQQKLATLPPVKRKAAMSRLVRALNDGRLEGQL